MFIKKITISNFHVFQKFQIDGINTPDEKTKGSGLTVLVGENGHGKSKLLEALALPLLPLRAKKKLWDRCYNFSTMEDVTRIEIYSEEKSEHLQVNAIRNQQKGRTVNGPAPAPAISKVKSIFRIHDDIEYEVKSSSRNMDLNEVFVLFLDTNRDFKFSLEDGKADACNYFIDRMNDFYFVKEGYHIVSYKAGRKAVSQAMKKLQKIGLWITKVHLGSFFAIDKDTHTPNSYSNLGSGYQVIFHFLYFFYLARQNGAHFVALIDEPELHLHPDLQAKFVKLLLEFSKKSQIIIATHSPLTVKQILQDDPCDDEKKASKMILLKRDGSGKPLVERVTSESFVLPYTSANEVNYVTFNLPTVEYYRELYEGLKEHYENGCEKPDCQGFDKGLLSNYARRDMPSWVNARKKKLSDKAPKKGKKKASKVTKYTYLRHLIHHTGNPEGNKYVTNLMPFTKELREIFREQKK